MTVRRGRLQSPQRNRFFYGKVMDVRQWRMEQDYGIDARALQARLGFGVGVLSGLEVQLDPDRGIIVRSGVALDPLGRTIVVPNVVVLRAPTQPTDCHGAPDGEPVTDGTLTLQLCYHECLIEPVNALACGCDTVERCEHSVVCEKYVLQLVRGLPDDAEPVDCPAMFPDPVDAGFDRRRAIWTTMTATPVPPRLSLDDDSECCVVLATIEVRDGAVALDPFSDRRVIYSNQALFELLMCLAVRVDACCGEPPPADPPRVMKMWPTDQQVISRGQVERERWVEAPRLELAFERPIDDSILDRQDDWLRVWSLLRRGDEVLARRVRLSRQLLDQGAPSMLTAAGDEQLVRYLLDDRYRREIDAARLVVQLRPGTVAAPTVVDASTPPLLLDGEHHGTALERQSLDELWDSIEQARVVDSAWWAALRTAAPLPLPTGEGHQGGDLDASFSFAEPDPRLVDGQPRLATFWPPNATFLRTRSRDERVRQWTVDFRARPHLELSFDGSFDAAFDAVATVPIDQWLRLWWVIEGNAGRVQPKRVELDYRGLVAAPHLGDPGRTIEVGLLDFPVADLDVDRQVHLVWVLRADPVSIDANFNGLVIDGAASTAAAIDELWSADRWAGTVLTGPASLGAALADGSPGGDVAAFFEYRGRA